MRTTRQIACVIICGTVLVHAFIRSSRADLILMNDGTWHAGRIIDDQPTTILLNTLVGAGKRKVLLHRTQVKRIFREVEEVQEIGRCQDIARLRRWAAAYYQTGVEPQSAQCIRRAWKLDPAIGEAPLKGRGGAFTTFWNRVILKERASLLTGPRARGLAELAQWAHDASLEDEAARYLRRAWSRDRKSAKVLSLARNWRVRLESAVRINLKPVLQCNLLTRNIPDEGENVPAKNDHVFLLVPLRYDLHAGNVVLSKSTVIGKERRGFYGVRPLRGSTDSLRPESFKKEPVYERMELRSRQGTRPQLVLRNKRGRRYAQGQTLVQDHLRGPSTFQRPSGSALLIIEVLDFTRKVTLEWGDGGSESIDLDFLRKVHEPVGDSAQITPDGAEIAELLRRLEESPAAMAELAIARLAQFRDHLPPERLEEWSTVVEKRIIAAGARIEQQVRSGAWDYFAAGGTVAAPALHALAEAGATVKHRWIEIVGSHIDPGDGRNSPVASQLLGAVLRSDDKAICDAALDVMLATASDWSLLGGASETAQLAALDRLGSLPKAQAPGMLYSLSRSVRTSSAERIARYARSVNLKLTDPHGSILSQWSSSSDVGERLALVRVLQAIDLGELIYSRPFGLMVSDASRAEEDERLREATFAALVDQVRRRIQAHNPTRPRTQPRSSFPLLVGMSAADPVVRGLTEAAASGSADLRLDALELLLHEGLPGQAERGLLSATHDPAKVDQVLRALMTRKDIARSSGLLALLGRFLTKAYIASAESILSHLDDVAADRPSERWSILAATKAGVDFKSLDQLATALQPPTSVAAIRWLCALGHLTAQERQRLAATLDPEQRSNMLDRIDLRRGQLVDGRYGALAIVETAEHYAATVQADEDAGIKARRRWRAPRRTTILLPPLNIRSNEEEEMYRVFWNDRPIGHGLIRAHVRGVRRPASFSPMLVAPAAEMLGSAGWGWPAPSGEASGEDIALGPVILPGNRPVRKQPSPGTMTLNITNYLRAGLTTAGLFEGEDLAVLVPEPYEITLRYAAFGSYYGVGVTRPLPPERPSPGRHHLMNLMLVLERMD